MSWFRLPISDTPMDTRKWMALLASFGGAIVLTGFAAWLVYIVWRGGWSADRQSQQLDILGWALILALGGAICANVGFSFVMGRRSFKISKDGLEASGGDE